MDENQALAAFAGISNQTRLRIVRFLVVAGADGRSAGAIGEALGDTSPSRLSFHLNQLQQSGLIESRREGRSIIYSAILTALSDLVAFLMHDCCEGIALSATRPLHCSPNAPGGLRLWRRWPSKDR
ncbi:ArsR family transcriptional regulator [Sphingomonas koreensis]|jgi:DNA-binding transcriptional ArsR family regulator|uniref:ArsR family transcriptional regulator n=1 Tax=Sphingomonas koreensis TaxID=93064 RepID=A0A430FZ74_9SPHN|nr:MULTISPECIES: metalloregulator ArsR/SmtB family transcription factor [Sphingomonadaceae]MDK2770311.1 helix-turn-helix domain-containing protein [Sphingomonas sp.]PJG45276.1 transcriptional regulator [Sphingobium sp. LB126]RSY78185.1 ArsR family transcriptional regulator [Sphingomonas koreensis]